MRPRANKPDPGVIDQPSLVLFGTAIPKHYYGALSERMLTNGFFARQLVIEAGKRKEGQEPGIIQVTPEILEKAKWWADFRPAAGNLKNLFPTPALVEQTTRAKELLVEIRLYAEKEYSKAEDHDDAVGTTVWGRVSEQTRKLALIYAVSENHAAPQIDAPAVQWASHLVLHQTRRMLYRAASYTAVNEFDDYCKQALRFLVDCRDSDKDYPVPDWLLRRRLAINPTLHNNVIEALTKQERIHFVTVSQKTKPRSGWALL